MFLRMDGKYETRINCSPDDRISWFKIRSNHRYVIQKQKFFNLTVRSVAETGENAGFHHFVIFLLFSRADF